MTGEETTDPPKNMLTCSGTVCTKFSASVPLRFIFTGEEKTDPLKKVCDLSPDEDDLFSDCRSDYSDSRFNSTHNFLAATSPGISLAYEHSKNDYRSIHTSDLISVSNLIGSVGHIYLETEKNSVILKKPTRRGRLFSNSITCQQIQLVRASCHSER